MPAAGPGSPISSPPEGFCAQKITSTNKRHSLQVPGERMLAFFTPRWWCSLKTHSQRDPAVFGRSLTKLMKPATSVILIWVPLISPHSCRAKTALSAGMLCASTMSCGASPRLPTSGGQGAGKRAGVYHALPQRPQHSWPHSLLRNKGREPKSNTEPRWNCSHYKWKHARHEVGLHADTKARGL